jgi:hypothetical protein
MSDTIDHEYKEYFNESEIDSDSDGDVTMKSPVTRNITPTSIELRTLQLNEALNLHLVNNRVIRNLMLERLCYELFQDRKNNNMHDYTKLS